jgi:hypothetical protein
VAVLLWDAGGDAPFARLGIDSIAYQYVSQASLGQMSNPVNDHWTKYGIDRSIKMNRTYDPVVEADGSVVNNIEALPFRLFEPNLPLKEYLRLFGSLAKKIVSMVVHWIVLLLGGTSRARTGRNHAQEQAYIRSMLKFKIVVTCQKDVGRSLQTNAGLGRGGVWC